MKIRWPKWIEDFLAWLRGPKSSDEADEADEADEEATPPPPTPEPPAPPPPPARAFENPAQDLGSGNHWSWKPYDAPGWCGRVFSLKIPSWFARRLMLSRDNSTVTIHDPVDPTKAVTLRWYQTDVGEGGAARLSYAYETSSGGLDRVRKGGLVVVWFWRVNKKLPVFVFRAPNSPQGVRDRITIDWPLPARVELTPAEAAVVWRDL
jgi:hypothetical protein